MENTEQQSPFEKINNIKEEVNIEDLVLPSKPTVLLNMETIDIKEEPLEKGSDTVSIHESKTDILNMETIDIKKEPLEEQNSNTLSIHESKKVSFATVQDKNFHSKMENEILKLFEEIDVMITVHDYNQIRVRKVKQLVEKYQRITKKVAFKLLEKTLEVKTNELVKTKQELQMEKSTNLILSKRIQDLELARNQVSGQKDKNLKSDLDFFVKQEESFVEKEVLVNNQETCNVNMNPIQFDIETIHEKKKSLARHIKLKHEKLKSYQCNSCSLLFSDDHDLKAHLNSVPECNKPKICSISGVSSLKLLGSFKNKSEQVLKEVTDKSKTINSGNNSIKVNEYAALLPRQKRKSFSTNKQKPTKLVRVLPPMLSLEDGSKTLENQKSAYEKWKKERQVYSDQKMLNQKINICHFENCEFSTDLESSLKQHITKKHGPKENYDNPDMTIDEQQIDPLGVSAVKEETLEELMFQKPELPQPDQDEFMTYADLIFEALNDASKGVLTLSGIYKSINNRHPQYKLEDSGWQSYIRSNLLINKSFRQHKKYWKIVPDPGFYDKPNMTYAQLIAEALNNAWEKTLVLSDICKAINNKHPYYELETQGWQNSIRHNLTLNKNFIKGKAKSGLVDNRGGYWKLTEDHSISAPKVQKRENQSLNKQDLDIQTTHVTKVKAKVKSTDAEMPESSDIDLIDLTATEQEKIGGRRCKEEFTCPYCEIVFDSKNEFTEHVVLHVEGYPCQTGGRNVKCLIPKCDAFFWTDGDMKQHLTKTHKMTK